MAVLDQVKTTDCCVCGTTIGMEPQLYERRLEDHDSFFCPNGHRQHFTGVNKDKRIEQLQRQLQERNAHVDRLVGQRNAAERSAIGYKAAAVRARNSRAKIIERVHAGVCPHCNRTFQQLARHMASKHAEHLHD